MTMLGYLQATVDHRSVHQHIADTGTNYRAIRKLRLN